MEHINGKELMNYLHMVRTFSVYKWEKMSCIEIKDSVSMEEEFSFLEGL